MGLGWALTENMAYDDHGRMLNPALRNYRIPAFADTPRTEVVFATPMTKSARSAPSRKANARSTQSRQPSPMRSRMRPECGSPTCHSRQTASSTSSSWRNERDSNRNARRRDDRHANAGARPPGG
jgi:hypothetical protein